MGLDRPGLQGTIDPLAGQAATLLAKAMVLSEHREGLWIRFQALLDEQIARIEAAPVMAALDELERRGVDLELLARLAHERSRARRRVAPPTAPGGEPETDTRRRHTE